MTFLSITVANMETDSAVVSSFETSNFVTTTLLIIKCVLCIYHLVKFKKNQVKIEALLDSDSKINAMTLAYTARLGLKIQPTDIEA